MRTYTRKQQRRNEGIAYVVVALYTVVAVGLSLWLFGRAFDHMTDPCRTADQRAMSPACR